MLTLLVASAGAACAHCADSAISAAAHVAICAKFIAALVAFLVRRQSSYAEGLWPIRGISTQRESFCSSENGA
jgi:hypothetical protein